MSMASGALDAVADGTLGLGFAWGACYLDVVKNGRVVWYLPLVLGCSKRTVTVPLPGYVGMRSPCRLYSSAIRQSHSSVSRPATADPTQPRKGDTLHTVD